MNHCLLVASNAKIANPSWHVIEDAVRGLGVPASNDTVILQAPDGELPWLTIGGKKSERFQLTIEERPAQALVLIDPSQPDEHVEVTFPFCEWDVISARRLVGLDDVLTAAKRYFENGDAHPGLSWKQIGKGLGG